MFFVFFGGAAARKGARPARAYLESGGQESREECETNRIGEKRLRNRICLGTIVEHGEENGHGKVVLHGRFPELEAELLGMIAGGEYEGPGTSPDRADAMVWGLTELMLGKEQAEPRIRSL